jgi:hypothetical protein
MLEIWITIPGNEATVSVPWVVTDAGVQGEDAS